MMYLHPLSHFTIRLIFPGILEEQLPTKLDSTQVVRITVNIITHNMKTSVLPRARVSTFLPCCLGHIQKRERAASLWTFDAVIERACGNSYDGGVSQKLFWQLAGSSRRRYFPSPIIIYIGFDVDRRVSGEKGTGRKNEMPDRYTVHHIYTYDRAGPPWWKLKITHPKQ